MQLYTDVVLYPRYALHFVVCCMPSSVETATAPACGQYLVYNSTPTNHSSSICFSPWHSLKSGFYSVMDAGLAFRSDGFGRILHTSK